MYSQLYEHLVHQEHQQRARRHVRRSSLRVAFLGRRREAERLER